MMSEINENSLAALRNAIGGYMSGKRLSHTLAVEREASALAKIYCPEKEYLLRAAALLHDITKELNLEGQLALCLEGGIPYTDEETATPKIFHSRTASVIIKRDFPDYASDELLDAVRWHTTGRANMTLCEELLFLADYIEDTRTFESCVELRNFFYNGIRSGENAAGHLTDTMILSFDLTIKELISDAKPIHQDTVNARNYFIFQRRGSINESTAK